MSSDVFTVLGVAMSQNSSVTQFASFVSWVLTGAGELIFFMKAIALPVLPRRNKCPRKSEAAHG
jgi:hypothetical protein